MFSAHTKESAKALVDTIQMTFPQARLALVVAMAIDKDHLAFAKEFLSGIVLWYSAVLNEKYHQEPNPVIEYNLILFFLVGHIDIGKWVVSNWDLITSPQVGN